MAQEGGGNGSISEITLAGFVLTLILILLMEMPTTLCKKTVRFSCISVNHLTWNNVSFNYVNCINSSYSCKR